MYTTDKHCVHVLCFLLFVGFDSEVGACSYRAWNRYSLILGEIKNLVSQLPILVWIIVRLLFNASVCCFHFWLNSPEHGIHFSTSKFGLQFILITELEHTFCTTGERRSLFHSEDSLRLTVRLE